MFETQSFLGKNKQILQKQCRITCTFVWLQCGQRNALRLCYDVCCSRRPLPGLWVAPRRQEWGGGAGWKCPSYTQTCLPTPRKQVARALRSDGTFSVSDGTIYEITLRSFLSCSGFCFYCYCDFSGNRILNTPSLRYLLV